MAGGLPLRSVVPLLALALTLSIPAAWALDPLGLQDDAGTGGDASDASDAPTLLLGGEYVGSIDGVADRIDWFTALLEPHQRLRVDYRATSGEPWFRVTDADGNPLFQALAGAAARRYIGMEGVSHRFEFDPGQQSVDPASYWFRVTILEGVPQDDAGTGGDAVSGAHLDPGAYTGTLHPASFDLDDWYTISKPWGGWVDLSFTSAADTSATLEVHGPWGAIASVASTDGVPATLATGADVRSLRVRTSEGAPTTEYALSFRWFVPGPTPPANDAGLGVDAPAAWSGLTVLPEGTYEGRAHYAVGDDVDRFAFYAPPGRYLQVTFELLDGTGTARVAVHADATTSEASDELFDGESVTFDGGSGYRILSVEKWFPNSYGSPQPSAEASYRFTVRAVARPDLDVADIRVEPPAGGYGFARRTVSADIVNPSDAIATTSLRLYVEDSAGRREVLAAQTVTLAPHSSVTISGIWMYSTYVGELTIGAASSCPTDPNAANDVEEIRASALVDPGLGVGTGATVVRIG